MINGVIDRNLSKQDTTTTYNGSDDDIIEDSPILTTLLKEGESSIPATDNNMFQTLKEEKLLHPQRTRAVYKFVMCNTQC